MRKLCTFHVHDLLLAVDVAEVQEVLQTQFVTRIPLADNSVAGLVNLRGQIVTAVDLRVCLGRPRLQEGGKTLSLIVRTDLEPISFLVDRMDDVIDVEESDISLPPETIALEAKPLITGGYQLDDGILLMLDTASIVKHVTDLHSGRTI